MGAQLPANYAAQLKKIENFTCVQIGITQPSATNVNGPESVYREFCWPNARIVCSAGTFNLNASLTDALSTLTCLVQRCVQGMEKPRGQPKEKSVSQSSVMTDSYYGRCFPFQSFLNVFDMCIHFCED